MRGAGGSRQAVVAVVATCALVALVALAALAGSRPVFEGEGLSPRLGVTTSATETPAEVDEQASPPPRAQQSTAGRVGGILVSALLTALAVLVAAGLVLFLVRRVADLLARRPEPQDHLEAGPVDVLARDRLAAALHEEADLHARLLREGSPRNAVVQCWHRFELLAGRAGLPRRSWETSTEFTARVLRAAGADPEAVATLAGLYREARFSDHPLEEADRATAAQALAAIQVRGLRGAGR